MHRFVYRKWNKQIDFEPGKLTKSFLVSVASLRRLHARIARLANDSYADAFIRASGWRRVFRINKTDATHMCL
jgi:hypothetical protein